MSSRLRKHDPNVERMLRVLAPKLAEIAGFPAQFGLGDGRVEKVVLMLGERRLILTPRSDGYWNCNLAPKEGDS